MIVDQGSPAFEERVIAERSAQKERKVPVLAMTLHHDMASYLEAMQLGVAGYSEKPSASNGFVWVIEAQLPLSSAKVGVAI